MAEKWRKNRQNHITLAKQVLSILLERGMGVGDHLPEHAMSEACGVSRTPMRAAFKILEENGFLDHRAEEGYFLAASDPQKIADAMLDLESMNDSLAARILADRANRRIGDAHSVSSLVRRYEQPRSVVLNALKILEKDGIVVHLPGQTWMFQPTLDSPQAVDESYAMRLTLEPQAILAPGFALDSKHARMLRKQMDDLIHRGDGRITSQAFARLDIDFHGFIAECSGNRFLRGTLVAHNRLRRATQKDTSAPGFRLRQAIEEHLGILDSLERNEFELAADQMVLHLRQSRIRRMRAANMGIPTLMKGYRP